MYKSKVLLLFLLLCSFSKNILSVRLILFNRTKSKIRIKYQAHGVSEPDSVKKDLLDKDVFVIPQADTRYRIAWAYVRRFESQQIMLGYQYRNRDIFLDTDDDYLYVITGHGKNRSNYTETLLTPEEAASYVTEINKINKIKGELKQFNLNITKRHRSFFGRGNPFDSHLESLLSQGASEIEKLSAQIKEWLTIIQESKRILDSKKTKINGYGDETLASIIEMDRKLAAFLKSKPEIPPSSVVYTSRVTLLPPKYPPETHIIAVQDEPQAAPASDDGSDKTSLETDQLEDVQVQLAARQQIQKLMREQEEGT